MFKSLIQSVLRGLTPQSAPSPEPPAVKPAAATKVDWVKRTHELNDFIHNIDLSPRDKHSLLLRTIESLKEERRTYIQNTNLESATRQRADAELVKLSLTTVREVRKLQEAYPELKVIKATPPTAEPPITKLSGRLGHAWALAATVLSPYATTASKIVTTFAAEKTTDLRNWASDTTRNLRLDAKEIKESLVSDIEDALSSILPSRPDLTLPSWANKKNAQIAATAGSTMMAFAMVAGVALHKDAPKPNAPETKPITSLAENALTPPAVWIPAEKIAPAKPAQKPTANIVSKKSGAAAKWKDPIDLDPTTHRQSPDSLDELVETFSDTPKKSKAFHKQARGHKYEHWNWDGLFTAHYKEKVVDAANRLLRMHPKEVFQGAILTESGGNQFNKNGQTLKSSANAYGAAQVLVPTAQAVAPGCTGNSLDHKRFMTDSSYNKKIGQCYFEEQHGTFGNNIAALLAYNSGPGDDKGRTGLKRSIRKSGISLENSGERMVDLISTIDNKENRHYVLKTMVRLGLLDVDDIGDDITNGRTHARYVTQARGAYKQAAYHYNDEHPNNNRTLSAGVSFNAGNALSAGKAFNAEAQTLRAGEISNHTLTGRDINEAAVLKSSSSGILRSAPPAAQLATAEDTIETSIEPN